MKNTKKYVLILFAALLMLAFTACGKQKVDMGSYLSLDFQGSNGNATAYVNLDYAELEHEIMSQWSAKEQTFQNLAQLTALETTITCDPETVEGVSNGDKITVTVTYDQKKAKELGISFQNTKKTFTVEGLQDAIMLDPFDETMFGPGKLVDVAAENPSPFLYISIENQAENGDPYNLITYRLESEGENCHLANGDSVKITATLSGGGDKYALSRTEITYTLTGHHSCITDASLLNHADLEKLREEMKSHLDQKMNSGEYITTSIPELTSLSVGSYAGGTWDSPAFTGYGYTCEKTSFLGIGGDYLLLVPFNMPIRDRIIHHWKLEEYMENYKDGYPLSLPNACGFFEITNMKLDGNGNVVPDSYHINNMKIFENQDLMDQYILENYGSLTPQNFN